MLLERHLAFHRFTSRRRFACLTTSELSADNLSTVILQLQVMPMQELRSVRCMVSLDGHLPSGAKRMYRLSNSFPYLMARLGIRMGDLFVQVVKREGLSLQMYRV